MVRRDTEKVLEPVDLTRVDAKMLAADRFAPLGDGFFRFRDDDLPRSFFDPSALRFCPICIGADCDSLGRAWGRALWQIDVLHVCPDHGTMPGAPEAPDDPRCPHDLASRIADDRARCCPLRTLPF